VTQTQPGPAIEPDPAIPLPPNRLRMGGRHFQKDTDFVAAGVRDVRMLRQRAGLGRRKRLLDWGCGAGRLAVGVKHLLGHVEDYHGVDVQPDLLGWAQEHLSDDHTRFSLVDARNARYNSDGAASYAIPAEPGSVDVLHAYSVLSHMLADDVAGYAATIADLLSREGNRGTGGRAAVTCFVEEDVPDCEENPADYTALTWDGPLHCVRYERRYFEDVLMRGAGLAVEEFVHGRETDGQSLYVLRRR